LSNPWPNRRDQGLANARGRINREVVVMPYRHTQPGILILVCCLLGGVVGAVLAWRTGQWPGSIVLLVVMIATAVVFSSLTVEVTDNELRWYFGPGLWTYRLPLGAIQDVAIVRNQWWNGFGIRARPGFRLYNVSGLDAVELRLGADDVRRIGTDDPQGLVDALTSRTRGR
jgi:hypothetical protein